MNHITINQYLIKLNVSYGFPLLRKTVSPNLKNNDNFHLCLRSPINSWHVTQASRVQFALWYAAHLGTESEHQVLNGGHIFLSLREYLYYLVLSSNLHVKWDKMKRENNPIRLPLETWSSLIVRQCACLYSAPGINCKALSFWNVHFFWLVRCLDNNQSNTCLGGDMEFLFSSSTRYLTRSLG